MSARQTLLLDEGWRFHLGEIDTPLPNTHIAAYMAHKAGYARGGGQATWDDSDWRVVDLPHDWSIEGEFAPHNHVDAGFLPRGVGWYRRHFVLDESDRGKHLALDFDGVASKCTIFVNGHSLHRNYCGYTPFVVDISDVARFGEADVNTIAVRVDATQPQGWWYEGAGIYRHVWLIKGSRVRIENVFVNPLRIATGHWKTRVETTVRNDSDALVDFKLIAGEVHRAGSVGARSTVCVRHAIAVENPALWSVESPNLHELKTILSIGERVVDEVTTTFGYRTIRFDAERGFFLNDRPVKLLGTCNHLDHAGLGVALPDSIHEFRIRRLKEMGCNAYRCAHHPPSRELLEICDRLGMLVIDENRSFGSSPQHLEELRSMVVRDRNHPCVILWSLCNEEAIQGTPAAAAITRTMFAELKRLDPSRPITAAVSGGVLNDDCIADNIEVMSLNYQLPLLDAYHEKHPTTPLLSGETTCAITMRGSERTELAPWGAHAELTWRHIAERPFVAGLFVWSGFDYRGEPTPHAWPYVTSQFGQLDICGFAKRGFAQHQKFFGAKTAPGTEETAGPAVRLGLEIHSTMAGAPIVADGQLALPITAFAVDAAGRRVGDASNFVTFAIEGPAQIIGVGNGDPRCHEPDKASSRSLFAGLAQVIVRTTKSPGAITLTASSAGLAPATLTLESTPAALKPSVPPAQRKHFVTDWRMSAITPMRPDLNANTLDQDVNSWERVEPGRPQSAWQRGGGYAIYRAKVTPPRSLQATGGTIVFRSIAGSADIYFNGALLARRPDGGSITIGFTPAASFALAVIIHADHRPAGLIDKVELR